MPNKDQPPKRQNKMAPEENSNVVKKNTGAIVVIGIVGILVLLAAFRYFSG